MRVYLLSTAVAPLGSGLGGGVEHMVITAARQLHALGYATRVIAPAGSVADVPELLTLPGRLAPSAVISSYDAPLPLEADAFLVAALRWLAERARPQDAILNFSYDWLPLFASDFLPCLLGSLISMGDLNRSLAWELRQIAARYPHRLAFLSVAQAASFGLAGPVRLIPPGLDLGQYRYNAQPQQPFCWLGRIAPEKGLEDAFAFAARTGLAVTVFGVMQNPAYWDALRQRYPAAPVEYGGFLYMPALAEAVREFRALLMTPKWLEAFGISGIQALACGTPVIAYQRGGISDYVRDGETGWLVKSDDIEGLGMAAERIGRINRARCRALVEQHYTLTRYGAALTDWLHVLAAGTTASMEGKRMTEPDGQQSWTLHIRKDALKFSAAHMTVFPDGGKERLHGHNYQVQLEVELAEPPTLARLLNYEVFKQALRAACDDWDEKVLIAGDNPWLEWLPGADGECAFRLCGKHYVLPDDETAVLATENITTENLARLLFERFWAELTRDPAIPWRERIRSAKLRVDESRGQGATYGIRFD